MIPINVTHTAIVTKRVHSRILSPNTSDSDVLPPPATILRHAFSTVISFFADSYKSTFGFNEGPPLHDALTIGYVSQPELFKIIRQRVDVELTGVHTMGETVVDVWNYIPCDDTWGPRGKNCIVTQSLDVDGFFGLLLDCLTRCDRVSPLNRT
jgi:uridine nucleosidase